MHIYFLMLNFLRVIVHVSFKFENDLQIKFVRFIWISSNKRMGIKTRRFLSFF